MERPPLWSGGLFVAFAVVTAFALWLLMELYPRLVEGAPFDELAQPLATVASLLVVLLAVVGRRVQVRMRALPPIVFHDEFVSLPSSLEATGPSTIPYGEILGTVIRAGGGQTHLLIEAVRRVHVYPARAFADDRSLEQVLNEFRVRIAALPDGASIMERMEGRALLAHKLVAKAPIVTQALIGVNIVFFANLLLLDALESPLGLVSWGANVPVLVWRGDLFRLAASSFLHAGLMHVVMELMALYAIGALLERVLGRTRFLVLYLSSALCGAVTTAGVGAAAVSVGATGGVYGLVASMALICRKLRVRLPVGIRQPRRWWAFIITVSVMLVLAPLAFYGFGVSVDLVGPAAGAASGLCLATLWMLVRPVISPLEPPNRRTKVAAFGLACAHALGLGLAVASAARFDSDRELGVVSVLVEDEGTEAGFLNYLAWMWGVDANALPRQIGLATSAARRAVEEHPSRADYRDTLATAHFRSGRLDEAIAVEREALAAADDDAFMASQLARFLDARLTKKGPAGEDAARVAAAVKLRFIAGGDTRASPARVVVSSGGSLGGGALIYVLAKDGDVLLGLLRLRVRPGTTFERELELRPSFDFARWPEGTELVIALAESLEDSSGAAELQWRAWPMDIRAASLP